MDPYCTEDKCDITGARVGALASSKSYLVLGKSASESGAFHHKVFCGVAKAQITFGLAACLVVDMEA